MKPKNAINGNETNINLCYRGLNPRPLWHSLVEAQIRKLHHLASIALARITLERQRQSKPAFRVSAVLEVPGPDFHAEASDYTLRAALLKVVNNLRRQMQSRKNRQLARLKNKARLAVLGTASPFITAGRAAAGRLAGPQRNPNLSRV
jgi:ribosome-associated translation inhibitor RaiA